MAYFFIAYGFAFKLKAKSKKPKSDFGYIKPLMAVVGNQQCTENGK
jgi:hypothetical protein